MPELNGAMLLDGIGIEFVPSVIALLTGTAQESADISGAVKWEQAWPSILHSQSTMNRVWMLELS